MIKKYKPLFITIFFATLIFIATWYIRNHSIAVLNPSGVVASKERDLMITATLLMLIVVVPVFVLTGFIAWRYREGNTKAKYSPDWDHNSKLEFTWWALPLLIIVLLSAIAWKSSHDLDPFKPIDSSTKPITIQVVAMQWKWLFIYPQQQIASVNYVQFPVGTPLNFEVTSDGPMNGFWIPKLGGQIYAMAGMSTRLHLMADDIGTYSGSSANISGKGFAGMNFSAGSSSQTDFDTWVNSTKNSQNVLTMNTYNRLSQPSENNPVAYYALGGEDIFNETIMKFMMPGMNESNNAGTNYMSGMGTP